MMRRAGSFLYDTSKIIGYKKIYSFIHIKHECYKEKYSSEIHAPQRHCWRLLVTNSERMELIIRNALPTNDFKISKSLKTIEQMYRLTLLL